MDKKQKRQLKGDVEKEMIFSITTQLEIPVLAFRGESF